MLGTRIIFGKERMKPMSNSLQLIMDENFNFDTNQTGFGGTDRMGICAHVTTCKMG